MDFTSHVDVMREIDYKILHGETASRKASFTCTITFAVFLPFNRVPTRTGKTGKPGKMGRHFPVREKSQGILNRLEKSGKTTQNTGKLRKFQKKIIYLSMIFKRTVLFAKMYKIFS